MRIHFIAIGGAAMHNLAIALKLNGHHVSGSDDEIFEPSKTRLSDQGLLPDQMGWHPEKVDDSIDMIILGMHARKDNPELLKATEIGIPIKSYPEFIYEQSVNKKRVVIGGSHGKTTTTSMILSALKYWNIDFDYMVGANIQGFDTMVRLSDSKLIILEGDEYLSSPIDLRAKFLWYKPHLAVITGIAWDHINVYPTKESYSEAFSEFLASIQKDGKCYYFEGDETLNQLVERSTNSADFISYSKLDYEIIKGKTVVNHSDSTFELSVFGEHNMQNMEAARLICEDLGVDTKQFLEAMTEFEGASNRLEFLGESEKIRIYRDFAHSPSKLKATVEACKKQFTDGPLLALIELHTFSSLNKEFLSEYQGCMDSTDLAAVYFSPETVEHKKLENIEESDIKDSFGKSDLHVFSDPEKLKTWLMKHKSDCRSMILMSSGNYGGIDIFDFSKQLLENG